MVPGIYTIKSRRSINERRLSFSQYKGSARNRSRRQHFVLKKNEKVDKMTKNSETL